MIAPADSLDECVSAAVPVGEAAPEARTKVCDCVALLAWSGGIPAALVEVSVTLPALEKECVLCAWEEGLETG